MDWLKETERAFCKGLSREDNLSRYAEKTGVNYSVINRLRSGVKGFRNLSLENFFRLFPELTIYFFRDELPARRVISGNDNNSGTINQGDTAIHGDNYGPITVGDVIGTPRGAAAPTATELRDLVVDCTGVSDRAKIAIMKILKEDHA